MDTRDALLAAIIADPDDDLPRLVYADWLDDSGSDADRARARLIRLQIEGESLTNGDRRTAVRNESERLIETHHREWMRGLLGHDTPAYYYKQTFRRGFLPYLCLDVEDLSDPGLGALFAREPVTGLFVRRIDTFPDSLAGWPHLPRIRELSASGHGPTWKAVLRSPLLTGLRTLHGAMGLDAEDVDLIASDPRFAGLTRLDMGSCSLGDRAVEAVARSPVLTRLAALEYGGNRTTIAALEAVAASPLAARLTVLDLREYRPDDGVRIGRRGAEVVAGFPALREVDLQGHHVGDDGAEALARSPLLSGVAALRLADNGLVRDQVAGFAMPEVGVS